MAKRSIKSGDRFSRLVVVNLAFKKGNHKYFRCICECGNISNVNGSNLITGNTVSCGCFRREHTRNVRISHGMSYKPIYYIWTNMKRRCYNKNTKIYHNYGGRGIKVCDRWINSFKNFLDDMGIPEEGMTLDRINTNGDYTKDNCRWASYKLQNRNRRDNRIIEYNGESMSLSEWAEKLGFGYRALHHRLARGWSVDRAFSTPMKMKPRDKG